MPYILEFALAFSLVCNLVLAVLLILSRRRPPKRFDATAQDLLHELTHGGAIVRIEVLDKEALLLRRS